MDTKWCYSLDGEDYHGSFDSKQEAIDAAIEEFPDEEYIYIGTCTTPYFKWSSCEECIIESIEENLFDDVGEWAENFKVSKEEELALAKMIDKTVEEWIKKYNINPNCYLVLDGESIKIDK